MRSSMSWHSAIEAGMYPNFLIHMLLTELTDGMTRYMTPSPDSSFSSACA